MAFPNELLLVLSAFAFGLRHGVDWDHIAAITDVTGSQDTTRRSLWLGTVYALGHATVITLLGFVAACAAYLAPFIARDRKQGKFWLDAVFGTRALRFR